jgi:cytidylate kinase
MSIITISRGSYSRGKDVAELVAAALGYECISREILLEASEEFNTPELKLVRALHDAPSILDRFTNGKERYVAYIRSTLLKHVRKDNVVYHGLGGHFFLQEIPHVFKVRIIAPLEDRLMEEMKRENISAEEARYILKKDDEERRKWTLYLYGKDTTDVSLYDMMLHINTMSVRDAVEIIQCALKRPCFQTTPQSQAVLNNLVLSSQVEAHLVKQFPSITAYAEEGVVTVNIKAPLSHEDAITAQVKEDAGKVEGVKTVKVYISPLPTGD